MNEQIEAIRAEIERRMEKHWDLLPDADSPEDDWTHNELCELGAYKELEHLETFIDSLPEETAPKGYDEAYLNECIAKASKTWEGVDVDKYMDEVRGNRPTLSDSSLENEMINYWGRIPDDKDLIDTARHFALWEKEQMLKEAVEGTVHNFSSNKPHPTVLVDAKGFNQGDKVRVIIVKNVKEDER